MELEEEQFDLCKLVQDEVNLRHHGAIKKGLDLILDPCDGSLVRKSVDAACGLKWPFKTPFLQQTMWRNLV
ncbi:Histidine kinase CKI1 [Senna tora]|uniref:Histidine kinase CKI1 n=1 Tax=Senna tora TaxID=362788 RepID=A0A834W0M6_9FABA|nr:Histidine kinase CKI1 [Senna tora]